jgi:hypothetical protein
MDAVSAGIIAVGIPEVGALEGFVVLLFAEVHATPDPVVIFKDRRLDGESERNVILFAEAGSRGAGRVAGSDLIFDSGQDQIVIRVHGEVGGDLVNPDDDGNDEGFDRGAVGTLFAGERIGADQKAIVDGAAASAGVKEGRDDGPRRAVVPCQRRGRDGLTGGGRQGMNGLVGARVQVAAQRFGVTVLHRISGNSLRRQRQRRKRQSAHNEDTFHDGKGRLIHRDPQWSKTGLGSEAVGRHRKQHSRERTILMRRFACVKGIFRAAAGTAVHAGVVAQGNVLLRAFTFRSGSLAGRYRVEGAGHKPLGTGNRFGIVIGI